MDMTKEKASQQPEASHSRVLGIPGCKIVMQIDLAGILDEVLAEMTGEKPPTKEGKVVPIPTAKLPKKD